MKITKIVPLVILMSTACAGRRPLTVTSMPTSEVHFGFAKDSFNEDGHNHLRDNIDYLKKNSAKMVIVEGHTDKYGSADYNLELGDRRAHQVMAYLVSQGVQPEQIVVVSYGEDHPKSSINHRDNRRAVVRLTSSHKGEAQ